MQVAHHRDHHHPPRLIRALLVLAAAAAVAAPAHAAGYVPLPSPAAPLSPQPPLLGGATASSEGVRHAVSASTRVDVSVDAAGAPFRVRATQRLGVRGTGDYVFTIGAPVVDVRPGAGSASTPGFRDGAVTWAGFDPSHRLLVAVATLDAARTAPSLPLRVSQSAGHTVLRNATATAVEATVGDAPRAQVLSYLASFRAAAAAGRTPAAAGFRVPGAVARRTLRAVAPLRVVGTVGGRRVSLVLRGSAVVPSSGRVDLHVMPLLPHVAAAPRLRGADLVAYAASVTLDYARAQQWLQFLGNPDPTGPSTTTFVYRTASRPVAVPAAAATPHGRGLLRGLAFAALAAVLLTAAAAAWARA